MSNNFVLKMLGLAAETGKIRIALPIALSAFTGFIIRRNAFDSDCLYSFLGVLFLACGSMALNQIQEKGLDSQMPRTRKRPIPSGRLSVSGAWIITLIFWSLGILSFLLQVKRMQYGEGQVVPGAEFRTSGIEAYALYLPLAFALLTVIWYNFIYTPLKKLTAFAAVPGSVVGALPPLIGWLSAGGSLYDNRIWFLSMFFFMGQIPHFWLLVLRLGEEYKMAGLPTLFGIFTDRQILRLTFWWILWTAFIAIILAFFGVVRHWWSGMLIAAGAVYIVISFRGFIDSRQEAGGSRQWAVGSGQTIDLRSAFLRLNFFYLAVMIMLWIDALIIF